MRRSILCALLLSSASLCWVHESNAQYNYLKRLGVMVVLALFFGKITPETYRNDIAKTVQILYPLISVQAAGNHE